MHSPLCTLIFSQLHKSVLVARATLLSHLSGTWCEYSVQISIYGVFLCFQQEKFCKNIYIYDTQWHFYARSSFGLTMVLSELIVLANTKAVMKGFMDGFFCRQTIHIQLINSWEYWPNFATTLNRLGLAKKNWQWMESSLTRVSKVQPTFLDLDIICYAGADVQICGSRR